MPITTSNGMTIVDDLGSRPNGPGIIQQLGNEVDAFYGPKVASANDLPGSGDFLGQRVWLVDVKGWGVWNGSVWVTDTAWITPTLGAGWTTLSATPPVLSCQYQRRAGQITVAMWVQKTSWLTADAVFALPAGFRPGVSVPFNCLWSQTGREFRIDPNGSVLAHNPGANGAYGSVTFPAAV